MVKHPWTVTLVLLALVGCNPPGTSVRKETHSNGKETIQESTRVSQADRESYQKEAQQKLDELNREIARWREKLDKAGTEAREGMKTQLKEFEKQRQIVAERLRELGRTSGPAWEAMKEGFHKAYEDLKEAARKAREKFQ
jgi:hypothetical protein